ncbi:hypothetical protein ACOME3_004782 [Neoechinorhynchus agilis]
MLPRMGRFVNTGPELNQFYPPIQRPTFGPYFHYGGGHHIFSNNLPNQQLPPNVEFAYRSPDPPLEMFSQIRGMPPYNILSQMPPLLQMHCLGSTQHGQFPQSNIDPEFGVFPMPMQQLAMLAQNKLFSEQSQYQVQPRKPKKTHKFSSINERVQKVQANVQHVVKAEPQYRQKVSNLQVDDDNTDTTNQSEDDDKESITESAMLEALINESISDDTKDAFDSDDTKDAFDSDDTKDAFDSDDTKDAFD